MKKVIYLFLLLMSYSCCHIPMMVINNKTNDDIQFLFDSKDSTVYVYPVNVKFPQTGKDSSKRGEIILCLSHGIPLTSA